jgi:hypothetical protein
MAARSICDKSEEKLMATRIRRGKEVEIPPEWVGNVTTPATIRQRPSKLIGKMKRQLKPGVAYKDARDLPLEPGSV